MTLKKQKRTTVKPKPIDNLVSLTLTRNDLGQIIDGIEQRAELYERTARYLDTDSPNDAEDGIAEVRDSDEARGIAEHYRAIIGHLDAAQSVIKTGGIPAKSDVDLHENIAAISAELWGGDTKFYERHGEALSGFPGVWMFAVDAAKIFTEQENRFAATYGTKPNASFEYLEAILPYAEWLKGLLFLPSKSKQAEKAWDCIFGAASFGKRKTGK